MRDPVRGVETEPDRHQRTAVVPGHGEPVVPELRHQRDDIIGTREVSRADRSELADQIATMAIPILR